MIKGRTIHDEIDSQNAENLVLCKNNPKDGFHKSNELLKNAELNDYIKGIGEAYRNLAFSSQLLGLIPEAHEYARKSAQIFET